MRVVGLSLIFPFTGIDLWHNGTDSLTAVFSNMSLSAHDAVPSGHREPRKMHKEHHGADYGWHLRLPTHMGTDRKIRRASAWCQARVR
jgi:hypothetical protein